MDIQRRMEDDSTEKTNDSVKADGDENRNPGAHEISQDISNGSNDFLVLLSPPNSPSVELSVEAAAVEQEEARMNEEVTLDDSHPSLPDTQSQWTDEDEDIPAPPSPPLINSKKLRRLLSDSTTTILSENDDDSSVRRQPLESRVKELEIKLAVLSKLLQQRPRPLTPPPNTNRAPLPPTRFTPHLESPAPGMSSSKRKHCSFDMRDPPAMPLNLSQEEKVAEDDNANSTSSGSDGLLLPQKSADNLEPSQPTPITPSQRNLSYTLLFEGDTEAYNQAKTPPILPGKPNSWTLQPALLQFPKASTIVAPTIRTKWLDFLNSSFPDGNSDVDKQMQEFIKVPGALESLLFYGFYVCVNSYLSILTVLPVRFLWSCVLLCYTLADWARLTKVPPQFRFHRRHLYQLIQVLILVIIYRYVLVPISIGKLYHWIRGQAMIKLYVIIAMVEIFDRLFSSLGQDCLDSLYWNTVHTPGSTRFVISAVVVLVYAALHTLILFVHVATLNVAMNSADQALLTLLISGNFAEIKSTVFKKYNKAALFKITTSDICERFKLSLFLGLVLVLNISQGMDYSQLLSYMRICGWVIATEIIADWIKHAFISKFNFISSSVYHEYSLLLAGDVTGIGHEGVNLNHSHAVVKRLGFAQIPLVAVMMRLMKEASKYRPFTWGAVIGMWVFLAMAKWALQSVLQWQSLRRLQAVPDLKLKNKNV